MSIEKVNIYEKLDQFSDHWNPRIVGALNGQHVKLVKAQGAFDWHAHEHEDEMFFVVKGSFEMHLRDRIIPISEGEFIIIPKGTEHRPMAPQEVQVMLFEPASTVNTGDKPESDFTQGKVEWI